MLLKRRVSVPNLWTEQLETSTVLIAEMIEPLAAPLSPEEQIQNPYTLGTTRIMPKFDRSFGKQEDLNLLMLVYNPRLTGGMPNVTVEYNFHTQTDAGEEFFNNTNPQEFNAQTLPPGFSVEAGHQIVAGQSVPLSLFPAGDYRLEITIKDNEGGHRRDPRSELHGSRDVTRARGKREAWPVECSGALTTGCWLRRCSSPAWPGPRRLPSGAGRRLPRPA